MRTTYSPRHRRRILFVAPRYARSFGTFERAYPVFGGRARAFMPPQGLLVVAAYLPETWEARFVDENSRPASADELALARRAVRLGHARAARQDPSDHRAGARAARQTGRARRAVGLGLPRILSRRRHRAPR